MADGEIVIRDDAGAEHVFPPGFDPQKAAAIVRGAQPQDQGWGSSLASIASPAGLEGLKQYGKELISGNGTARADVADYGKKEGTAFVSTLNPVNQAKGILRLATTNPITTAKDIYGTGKSALEGDPTAIGNILGTVVAPKADAAALRGVNSAASAVAASPKAQAGLGYVAGAGTAMLSGLGHPFIGAAVGRMAAPVIGDMAEGVSKGTGAVLDKLNIRDAPSSSFLKSGPAVERYAPNSSGYQPPDAIDGLSGMIQSDALPKGPAQGVYAALPDGSWGVKAVDGHTLTEGAPVNVTSRGGIQQLKTVGKIGPDGIATIGDTPLPPTSPESWSVGGQRINTALRDKILKHLRDQGE